MNCMYHIDKKALWHCPQCEKDFCMDCGDLEPGATSARCVLCREHMLALGMSDSIEPFWNRLSDFNKYPLQVNALNFILIFLGISFVAGLLISLIPLLIFFLLCQLALLSIYINYSFKALTKTASGNFISPTYDESVAFNSDKMTWPVIALSIIFFLSAFAVGKIFGGTGLVIYLGLLIFAAPAILIVLGMSRDLATALNPTNIIGTIAGIGMPYLILVGLVFVINVSTYYAEAFISLWLPDPVVFSLSYTANLFFNLIMFHMLGYVVYQYHDELGHGVDVENIATNENAQITPALRQLSHAEVYIHEGRFEDAQAALLQASEDFKCREKALGKLIKLYINQKNKVEVIKTAKNYFEHPELEKYAHNAMQVYLDIYQLEPRFRPMNINARAVLLSQMKSKSNQEHAQRLMADLEEKFADEAELDKALIAKARYQVEVLQQDKEAIRTLKFLIKNFPRGEHISEARQLVMACKKLMG